MKKDVSQKSQLKTGLLGPCFPHSLLLPFCPTLLYLTSQPHYPIVKIVSSFKMAQPTAFAAVCLLTFLFSIADARLPLGLHTKEAITTPDFPDSDPAIKATILLPSDKPEDLGLESASKKLPEEEEVPITMVKFRPVNRHFSLPPTNRFRHNCHHNNRLHPLTPRYGRIRDIPYGDEVLPAAAADHDSTFSDVATDRPLRWTDIDYEKPNVNLEDHKKPQVNFRDDILMDDSPQFRHRHRHHRLGRLEKKLGVERQNQKQENPIVKKIRKFLNHF